MSNIDLMARVDKATFALVLVALVLNLADANWPAVAMCVVAGLFSYRVAFMIPGWMKLRENIAYWDGVKLTMGESA